MEDSHERSTVTQPMDIREGRGQLHMIGMYHGGRPAVNAHTSGREVGCRPPLPSLTAFVTCGGYATFAEEILRANGCPSDRTDRCDRILPTVANRSLPFEHADPVADQPQTVGTLRPRGGNPPPRFPPSRQMGRGPGTSCKDVIAIWRARSILCEKFRFSR